MLSFIILISVASCMFLLYFIHSSSSLLANFYCAIAAGGIIVINITMYILLANFADRHAIQRENTLLRMHLEHQNQSIEKTKKQYEELKKLRHDHKNIIRIIESLNNENKKEELSRYLSEYLKKQEEN